MRKTILAVAAALFASSASAAILGSSHDFSVAGSTYYNLRGGSDCAYCHMPHNSPTTVTGAPLWARNINYTQTYTVYASAVTGHQIPAQPNAGSRVCLSCHDGTQAMSVVFQVGGGTQNLATSGDTTTMAAGATQIGIDLRNDHPVSVTYSTTATVFGLSASPDGAFNIATVGTSTVECTSCHNAHNARGAAASYPNRQFMVAYSGDFCGGCHSGK